MKVLSPKELDESFVAKRDLRKVLSSKNLMKDLSSKELDESFVAKRDLRKVLSPKEI